MLTKIDLCTHIRNVLCILMYMRIYGSDMWDIQKPFD